MSEDEGKIYQQMPGSSCEEPYTDPQYCNENYLGQPAASIPAGSSPDGLPLAVQVGAPPNREDLLISLGVDTYIEDPISKFQLVHEDYLTMGTKIAAMRSTRRCTGALEA